MWGIANSCTRWGLLGGLFLQNEQRLGQLLPFDFEGMDFCMTALFVTILIDQ